MSQRCFRKKGKPMLSSSHVLNPESLLLGPGRINLELPSHSEAKHTTRCSSPKKLAPEWHQRRGVQAASCSGVAEQLSPPHLSHLDPLSFPVVLHTEVFMAPEGGWDLEGFLLGPCLGSVWVWHQRSFALTAAEIQGVIYYHIVTKPVTVSSCTFSLRCLWRFL